VPASGLEPWILTPSGFASSAANGASRIHEYCDVTGYVAPQNKFELKLPLPGDWNQKFFFYACGGFCGTVFRDACNLGLARGYASATGNGGHDSALGFDGVWAANAPVSVRVWAAAAIPKKTERANSKITSPFVVRRIFISALATLD
jgi:hypothetical protein